MNRKLGGAEQAFLDYYSALTLKGHDVVNITSLFAKINNKKISSLKLPNLFPWCILSKISLKLLILIYRPDLIIAHGGRAVNFAYGTGVKVIPIVSVRHSYSTRHILKCNYIIAVDQLLKKHLISSGYPESRIFIVPNMINTSSRQTNNFRQKKTEYVIGALRRFVPEKGFNYLIEAISILRDRKYPVKLLIGGAGPLEIQLKKLTRELNIDKNVEFIGWVHDKENFFKSVDIFCIPSVFETFGIVALEAMSYQVPIVATKTGGASQIFAAGSDALITNTASNQGLANSISYLIDNPLKAQELIDKAYSKVINYYDTSIVADRLSETLKLITQKGRF